MKLSKKILINLLVLGVVVTPIFVFGQGNPSTGGTGQNPSTGNTTIGVNIENPFKGGNTLMELVTTILNNVVMPIAAVAVVIFIIWAGFTFLQAQGKPAEIDKAKQRLLWSLIGAGVLLGAAGISAVVQSTINSLINP